MKKFCESLREHLLKIINFEKKKMIPLTHEEYESYLNQIKCPICKKNIEKLKTIVIWQVNTEVLHIVYVI